MKPELFDTVELVNNLPEHGLRAGALGAVIEDYGDGHFEIEFANEKGETEHLAALPTSQFIVVWRRATHEPVSTAERVAQFTERLDPQSQEQMLTFSQFLHTRRQPMTA